MDLIQVGGSLIAIIILALITAKLFPNTSRLTPDRIVRNVKRYCPDILFDPSDVQVFLGEDDMSAVLVFPNRKDGIALATALGDRVVVRHIPTVSELTVTPIADGLSISIGDFTQPSVKLILDDTSRETLGNALSSPVAVNEGPAHA